MTKNLDMDRDDVKEILTVFLNLGLGKLGATHINGCAIYRFFKEENTLVEKEVSVHFYHDGENILNTSVTLSGFATDEEKFEKVRSEKFSNKLDLFDWISTNINTQLKKKQSKFIYAVTGKSFPVKDELKKRGFKFSNKHNSWVSDVEINISDLRGCSLEKEEVFF